MKKLVNGPRGTVGAKSKRKLLAIACTWLLETCLEIPKFTYKRSKGSIKDTLQAVLETSNQFFEKLSYDLRNYVQHSKRGKIEESNVIAVMQR